MNGFWTSIRRTPYQSLASFLILFFTLFLSLFFFNLTSFFNGVLSYVETKPQVTVYFQTSTKEDEISKVKQDIDATGQALSIKYISKQDALKIYQNLNKNNPLLLEMVSADILPASLEIYAKSPEYLLKIADMVKKEPGVDEVVFQRDIVDKLLSLTNVLRKVSIFILAFLIIIAFIVLMTTSAFKIALKKDEIELLQLLGASKFYVQWPFLYEGMAFGWMSGTLAFVVYYAIFFSVQASLSGYLSGIGRLEFFGMGAEGLFVWPPSSNFIVLSYVITILFGMLIGFIGNYLSTSKYIS
jgi:cell division transport system permease protein